MGIQTAWMLWLGQVAAPAANANLFVIYLGEFFPHAKEILCRAPSFSPCWSVFFNFHPTFAAFVPERKLANLFTAAKPFARYSQ